MQYMVRLMVSCRVTRRWRMRRILGTAQDLSFRLMSSPKLVNRTRNRRELEERMERKPLLVLSNFWTDVSTKYVFGLDRIRNTWSRSTKVTDVYTRTPNTTCSTWKPSQYSSAPTTSSFQTPLWAYGAHTMASLPLLPCGLSISLFELPTRKRNEM